MGNPVLAFKDNYGKLHDTEKACDEANENYRQIRMRSNAEDAITSCVQGVNWYFSENIRIRQQLSLNWEKLRDLLNKIEVL